jgi:hypothetical protein
MEGRTFGVPNPTDGCYRAAIVEVSDDDHRPACQQQDGNQEAGTQTISRFMFASS